ncbi:MAG: ATP-binding protein [Pseudomonadota bacterium]
MPHTDSIANDKISSLTGEFVNPALEQSYLHAHWNAHARQLRLVLLISMLTYMFAFYQNYLDLGECKYLWWIMISRLAAFSFVVWAIYETYTAAISLRLQAVVFIVEILIGISEAVETIAYHEAGFVINLLSAPFFFFVILIYYAFIQIRWSLTTLASLIGGVFVIVAYIYMAQEQLQSIIRHPVMLMGVIAIGGAVIRSMNRIQRHSWLQGKKLEIEIKERRRAEQKALEASRVKGEFLAVMSHEIRTPLNSILAMSEVLSAEKVHQNDRSQRQLNILSTAGKHLNELIEDILDFSRIEAKVNTISNASFDLCSTVNKATTAIQNLAKEKGLELNVHIDANFPSQFLGDAQRIRQILINLVGNAIKFTDTGHVNVQVGWSEDIPGSVHFVISDTGIGIADADLSNIFDPFHQLDSSSIRKHQGTGLGLAISHNLAEQMGGRLSARKQQASGAVFDFLLPLVETDAISKHSSSILPSTQQVETPSIYFSALVVEDSELNRLVIEEYLMDIKCDLQFAENGRQGFEAFKQGAFDIILMDLQMPELDGIAATKMIRSWEQESALEPSPIIIISADSLAGARQCAEKAGANSYITKPMSKSDLFNIINQYTQENVVSNDKRKCMDTTLIPLLPQFFTQTEQDIKAMAQAIDNVQINELVILAHIVKGHCQMFGFPQIAMAVTNLHNAAESSSSITPALQMAWEEFQISFDLIAPQREW